MRSRHLLAAVAALAVSAALAAPAAAVTVTLLSPGDPNTLPAGQILVADFNTPADPEGVLVAGFALDLVGATVGVGEGTSGYSGTLYADPTTYLTVPGNASATLTSTRLLKSFSLYMGSADTYNAIRFIGAGYDETLTGGQLSGGYVGQSWNWGHRVNFDFGGAKVDKIILTSGANSFEVDNFAVAAVPEPATWAMMIMGFVAMGSALRRRRPAMVPAFT